MATLVKERGTNFELTAEAEKELRRAGAEDDLIAQIRSSARARPNVAKTQAQDGLREIERALKELQSWQQQLKKTESGRAWDSRGHIGARLSPVLDSSRQAKPIEQNFLQR